MDNYKHLDERFNKIHLMVCIVAAASVIVACIIRGENLYTMALLASVAIIVFYFIGNMVRYYIVTRIFPAPPSEDEEAANGEASGEASEGNPDDESPETSANPDSPASPRSHDYLSRE